MLLIDQHAGHERILFDKYMNELDKQELYSQDLVVPYILNLNPIEENYITNHLDDLNALGFLIEYFGASSFKVSAVPVLLNDINLKEFFADILKDLKSESKITVKKELRHRIATMACKSAVKGGESLADSEIKYLINTLDEKETQLLCPHGRPIVIKITKDQIEKWFKRIV